MTSGRGSYNYGECYGKFGAGPYVVQVNKRDTDERSLVADMNSASR